MKSPEVADASIKEAMDKEIRKISIRDIHVPPNRRALKAEAVTQLANSMRDIGLRTPITVYQDKEKNQPVLVAGWHRLEAAKQLGWDTIDALFDTGTPDERRMWEIAENLHRAELTALERDEQVAEWIRLAEQRAADIKASADDNKLSQVATVSKGGRGNEGGVRAAARELGIDKDDAHRALKVAGLSKEAKQTARETGLANNRTVLLKATTTKDGAEFLRKERVRRDTEKKDDAGLAPYTAEEYAEWILPRTKPEEIPTVISLIEAASPKDVVNALRKSRHAVSNDGRGVNRPQQEGRRFGEAAAQQQFEDGADRLLYVAIHDTGPAAAVINGRGYVFDIEARGRRFDISIPRPLETDEFCRKTVRRRVLKLVRATFEDRDRVLEQNRLRSYLRTEEEWWRRETELRAKAAGEEKPDPREAALRRWSARPRARDQWPPERKSLIRGRRP